MYRGELASSTSQRSNAEPLLTPRRVVAVLIATILACVLVFFLIFGPSLLNAILGLVAATSLFLIVVSSLLIEIKAPDIGLLYRFGRVAGFLEPGWYMLVSPFERVEDLSLVPIVVEDRSTRLTGSFSRVTIAWQAHVTVDPAQIDQLVRVKDVSGELIWSTVWSSVTSVLGRLRIRDWQQDAALPSIQEAAELDIRERLSRFALRLDQFLVVEAADQLGEEVQGIVLRGKAQAEAYGDLALATQPTRGDIAHAISFVGASIAESIKTAFS